MHQPSILGREPPISESGSHLSGLFILFFHISQDEKSNSRLVDSG